MVNMGDVWDRATEFLGDNIGPLLPLVLLAIFVPVAVQGSLSPLAQTPGTGAVAIQVISLVLSLVMLWGQLAIIAMAIDPATTRDIAARTATRRLLPAIGVSLAVLAALIILTLPIPVALALTGFDFKTAMLTGSAEMPPSASIFTGLYGVLLLVVMLWAAARLALLNPVIVAERRGFRALARSFALTRGIAWKIIGVMILFAIVAVVAVLATKMVFGSILALVAGGDGLVTVATVLTAIFTGIVTTGFTVLAAAFTAKLYLAAAPAAGAAAEPA